jgi:hypothetical protein
MAVVTMAVAVGTIGVVGIITGTSTTGSMVTKGSVVESAEVMKSMAATTSMVEVQCAVVAASTVEAAQVMEADTDKRGFFAWSENGWQRKLPADFLYAD